MSKREIAFLAVGIIFNTSVLFYLFYRLRSSTNSKIAVATVGLLVGSSLIVLLVSEYGVLSTDYVVKKFGAANYEKADRKNLLESKRKSKKNPYGFRVDVGKMEKKPGIKRIVVMGDSFVWGDGLADPQDIWSRKLAGLIKKSGSKTIVTDFGRNGWATCDQFNFLKKYGMKYNPDLIVWGFVDNDPDLYEIPRFYILPKIKKASDIFFPFLRLFPETRKFFVERIKYLLVNNFSYFNDCGYPPWLNKLYGKKNLERYSSLVLQKLKKFQTERNIPFFFATLPNAPEKAFVEKYRLIKAVMKKNKIVLLDLYPRIAEKFGHIPTNEWKFKLAANPGNGHPGPKVTRVYAQEVFNYLKEKYPQYLFY